MDTQQLAQSYFDDGFLSGFPVMSDQQALEHRARLEEAETLYGPMHYRSKLHTVSQSILSLVSMPSVLDLVEALIGPDILLYNSTFIIKEPNSPSHVSWHQDLTYWGMDSDKQVSMWLALSPANAQSGCMRMIPGSHRQGQIGHEVTDDQTNVLLQGQTVRDVDESQAVLCPLAPGEASFHHGFTLHASMPNQSDDRRIGLNVQYIATDVKQLKSDSDTALLIRGEDRFGYYLTDPAPEGEYTATDIARQDRLRAQYEAIAGTH
ncbi:MAG: phytanoyl-CoA dioxygenase family protein [Gammaproteobacteria bacterium]|nr:phytanoyl-CoA dioxygenase family protein [Gammaproteobacteria bacterium]